MHIAKASESWLRELWRGGRLHRRSAYTTGSGTAHVSTNFARSTIGQYWGSHSAGRRPVAPRAVCQYRAWHSVGVGGYRSAAQRRSRTQPYRRLRTVQRQRAGSSIRGVSTRHSVLRA
eukprot:2284374-Rhodomonas_salina.2